MEGKTEEEIEMMKIMGFGGFSSSKVSIPCLSVWRYTTTRGCSLSMFILK